MEKDAAQSPTSLPPITAFPLTSTGASSTTETKSAIPTVDTKATLKIETTDIAPVVDTTDRYGTKLFFFGVVFCLVLAFIAMMTFFFWLRGGVQPPQVVSTTQSP